jgi:sec-independent protein translocase protein TatC
LSKLVKSQSSPNAEGREMGFLDHLEELRWHIIRGGSSIIVIAIIVFLNEKFVFDSIIYGPKKSDFPTYNFLCWLSEATCLRPPELQLITRELGEQFFVHLKVSFWMGLIVAFPYIFYEFWQFIKPGLYKKEQKAARGLVAICSFLFAFGVLFGFYVIAPFAISWLGSYTVGTETINSPTLASYVNYLTMCTIPIGIIFEFPVVAYFLGKIGLLSSAFLKSYRRHAIVIIFIMSAIITPPDVITQVLISLPVLILYEISIRIIKGIEKRDAVIENAQSDD